MDDDIHSPATTDWVNALNSGSPVTSPIGAFSCTVYSCREVFTRGSLREEHIRAFHRPVPQTCHQCDVQFQQAARWKEHVELLHTDGPPFECSARTNIRSRCSCGRIFSSKALLHRHQRSFVASPPASPAKQSSEDAGLVSQPAPGFHQLVGEKALAATSASAPAEPRERYGEYRVQDLIAKRPQGARDVPKIHTPPSELVYRATVHSTALLTASSLDFKNSAGPYCTKKQTPAATNARKINGG